MEYHINEMKDIQKMMYDNYIVFNGSQVVKELGEPLFIQIGDTWYFDEKERGFICYREGKVKYLYVYPLFRKFGLGTELLNRLPEGNYTTVATIMSVHLFAKKGFKITKSFKNYFYMSYSPG